MADTVERIQLMSQGKKDKNVCQSPKAVTLIQGTVLDTCNAVLSDRVPGFFLYVARSFWNRLAIAARARHVSAGRRSPA
jgi:hypothetical protein